MSSLRVIKCSNIDELQAVLRGSLKTRQIDAGLYGLVGKTLVFTVPAAATCTFVAGSHDEQHNGYLTVAEIISQLTTAITGLKVGTKDRALVLSSATGVTITGGTARDLFGLNANGTSQVAPYAAPGGAAPAMVTAYFAEGSHVLIVNE